MVHASVGVFNSFHWRSQSITVLSRNGYFINSSGFYNATTPILNPNHSIMMQASLALIGVVGSLILLL